MVKLPQNYEERIKTDDLNNNNSHPKTIVIIIRVLNAPSMLISIIGNSGVLATILRAPSLRSPTTVQSRCLRPSSWPCGTARLHR